MSKRSSIQTEDETDDEDEPDPRHQLGHAGPSSMLSPSSPEDGDLDPAPSLLHRRERDDQERLDLEEEMRERVMSEAQGELGAGFADLDMQDRKLGESGTTSRGPEKGECRGLALTFSVDPKLSSFVSVFPARFPFCLAARQYSSLSHFLST